MAHLFNKLFMYLLFVQDTFLFKMTNTTQYLVYNQYAKIIFLVIIHDTCIAKIPITKKS